MDLAPQIIEILAQGDGFKAVEWDHLKWASADIPIINNLLEKAVIA